MINLPDIYNKKGQNITAISMSVLKAFPLAWRKKIKQMSLYDDLRLEIFHAVLAFFETETNDSNIKKLLSEAYKRVYRFFYIWEFRNSQIYGWLERHLQPLDSLDKE